MMAVGSCCFWMVVVVAVVAVVAVVMVVAVVVLGSCIAVCACQFISFSFCPYFGHHSP